MDNAATFGPGVVVFARVKGHPWWPAVIARYSETTEWRRSSDDRIWCMFFNEPSGAWLKQHELRPFDDCHKEECMVYNRGSNRYRRFLARIADAVESAEKYVRMDEKNDIREEPPTPLAPWARPKESTALISQGTNYHCSKPAMSIDRQPVDMELRGGSEHFLPVRQSTYELDDSTDSGADALQGSSDCDEPPASGQPSDALSTIAGESPQKDAESPVGKSALNDHQSNNDVESSQRYAESHDVSRPRRKRTKSMRYDGFIDPSRSARRSSRLRTADTSTPEAAQKETVSGHSSCSTGEKKQDLRLGQSRTRHVVENDASKRSNCLKVRVKLNKPAKGGVAEPLARTDTSSSRSKNDSVEVNSDTAVPSGVIKPSPIKADVHDKGRVRQKRPGKKFGPSHPSVVRSERHMTANVEKATRITTNRKQQQVRTRRDARDCDVSDLPSDDAALDASRTGGSQATSLLPGLSDLMESSQTPAMEHVVSRLPHCSRRNFSAHVIHTRAKREAEFTEGVDTDSESDAEKSLLPISGRKDITAERALDAVFGDGSNMNAIVGNVNFRTKRRRFESDTGDLMRLLLHRVSVMETDIADMRNELRARNSSALGEDATAAELKSALEALANAGEAFARRRNFDPDAVSRALSPLLNSNDPPFSSVDGGKLQSLARDIVLSACER